jgi:hypothetical protein
MGYASAGSSTHDNGEQMQRTHGRQGSSDVVTDLVKGAIAGAVAVWAMDRVGWWMWNREDPAALRQEREARVEGMDPAHVTGWRKRR